MSIKLAINGFGRIGRLAFRRAIDEGMEVVAINDLSSAANLAYLLKYDSAQGVLKGHEVSYEDNNIVFDGKKIPVIGQKDPNLIKWSDYGVDIVLECTGRFKGYNDAKVHVEVGGAKGVVISAPADKETPTFVYGVNDKDLTADMKVISGASCTTNCLGPVCRVLQDKFGIEGGFMTTVHAYTGDQMVLDGPHRKGDLRRARAAAVNIVPNSTGAAKAIGLVIPELNGKLIGSAQRVPVPTGSTTILIATVKGNDITPESINAAMKAASNESYGYTEEPLVSSDIIGITYGSLFDATQTMVTKIEDGLYQVQVVAWYDNENSYTSQMVRTIKYFAELGE